MTRLRSVDRGARLRQLIVLLPTVDMELSSPVFVYAVTAKYQFAALRLVTT